VQLLQKALFVAARVGKAEDVRPLVVGLERLLGGKAPQALTVLEPAVGECLRGLRNLGMRDEIRRLSKTVADVVLEGKEVGTVDFRRRSDGLAALRTLLHVAAAWSYLGRSDLAEPVLQATRHTILEGEPLHPREQTLLSCAYARALGQSPQVVRERRLEELLKSVKGVNDTFTTSRRFSTSQLDVVESVTYAAVGE
jgi:cellulose synthase operon protein C